MREFLLCSRTGRTDGNFRSLVDAGRLDVVYQCILTSIFKSQAHRKDVVFHAVLGGAPRPPVHIAVSGAELRDAKVDERSWEGILRKVLSGGEHPGVTMDTSPLQGLVKERHEMGYRIFMLNDRGEPFGKAELGDDNLFVLGDQVGLSRNDEGFVLRYGRSLSIGREKYLAATCIDVINYLMDMRA